VLEAIVGDLPSPGAAPDAGVVRRADGSWLLDGSLPLDRLARVLGERKDLDKEAEGYRTLGGFVLARLGRIPAPGDGFAWAGWRFEVADMDGNRVDKVLAVGLPPAAEEHRPD
jgi:putative hemolysin